MGVEILLIGLMGKLTFSVVTLSNTGITILISLFTTIVRKMQIVTLSDKKQHICGCDFGKRGTYQESGSEYYSKPFWVLVINRSTKPLIYYGQATKTISLNGEELFCHYGQFLTREKIIVTRLASPNQGISLRG
jgi:hypothetical protein